MSVHSRIIQLMFVGAGSLGLLLVSIQSPTAIQGLADSLFSSFLPYPQFRLWLFDAIVIASFFLFGVWAVHGVHGHGYREGVVDGSA